MLVLGIDPGTRFVGYGVVFQKGWKYHPIDYGLINVSKIKPYPQRLRAIYDGIVEILEEYPEIEVMAIEEVFMGKNVKSAMKVGEARGVVQLCAAQREIPLYEFPATVVKKSVTGSGRAHKTQVQAMVIRLLNLPQEKLKDDVSDALAIAMCFCQRKNLI